MADDSLVFATDDTDYTAKLNRKTRFVGTGAQIDALTNTYAGQIAYCTSSNVNFNADSYYIRNAANSAWVEHHSPIESIELSSSPLGWSNTGGTALGTAKRWYNLFTMPSTDRFYLITGIEWRNGGTLGTSVLCGVDLISDTPAPDATPTKASSVLMGITPLTAQSGADALQRSSLITCNPIRAGSSVGIWISTNNSTGNFRYLDTGYTGINKSVAYTATPPTADSTAWGTDANFIVYLKAYYVGYS